MDWKGKVRRERGDVREHVQNQNSQKRRLGVFSPDLHSNGRISGPAGDRREVSRAWNSFCNQDPDARQVAKLPLPHIPPCSLSEDRVCQPPPDTRLTCHSRSRLKPSAWARKAKYIVVGKSWGWWGAGGRYGKCRGQSHSLSL